MTNTHTCTNGHTMEGIGFDTCPECDAPWKSVAMTTPTKHSPVADKVFGYPGELYQFTGRFEEDRGSSRQAARNKKVKIVPVYQNKDGKLLLDMSQAK